MSQNTVTNVSKCKNHKPHNNGRDTSQSTSVCTQRMNSTWSRKSIECERIKLNNNTLIISHHDNTERHAQI